MFIGEWRFEERVSDFSIREECRQSFLCLKRSWVPLLELWSWQKLTLPFFFPHCYRVWANPQINQMIAEVLDTKWRFTPKYARTGIPNVQQLLLNKAPQLVFTQVANVTKWLTRRTCEPGDGPNSAEPLINVLSRGIKKRGEKDQDLCWTSSFWFVVYLWGMLMLYFKIFM